MKTLLITLTFVTVFSSSNHAQTEKRNYLVGGTARMHADIFSISSHDFRFGLYPQFGVFVKDNFALGGKLSFLYENWINGSTDERQNEFYYGLEPFARYYFKKKNNRRFFLEGELGLLGEYAKHAETVTENYVMPYGSVNFGLSYMVSESVGLEPMVVLSSFGLGLNVGFQVYIDR